MTFFTNFVTFSTCRLHLPKWTNSITFIVIYKQLTAEENMQEIVFPLKTSELAAIYNKVKEGCLTQFKTSLEQLQDNEAFNKSLSALMVSYGIAYVMWFSKIYLNSKTNKNLVLKCTL